MINPQPGCAAGAHLDVEGSALNLRRALLDDEWDAVWAILRRLGKVNTKQLQSALELFMAALDCERFQALLVAGQRALVKETQTVRFQKMCKSCLRRFLMKSEENLSFLGYNLLSHPV